MLTHLAERPNDFSGAFRRLPFKLRELFIQAFQSFLFNRFLSERIERGLPLNMASVGDYVVNVDRSGLPMVRMHRTVEIATLEEINDLIRAGKMRLAIPLIGFKQRPSDGVQGEIEKRILEEENVSMENFRITVMPEMATRGQLRTVTTPLNDFSLDEVSQDAARPARHMAKVSFMLQHGSYATILLRELMKPRNVIEEGF
jgi:tRNA pseudouridine13 synthase